MKTPYTIDDHGETTSSEFEVGDRVEGGEGDDHDTGRVIEIDGDEITVAWDSGVRTTQPADLLKHES
jgi:hypothetical protein